MVERERLKELGYEQLYVHHRGTRSIDARIVYFPSMTDEGAMNV